MDEEDPGTNGSRPPYRYIADVLRGEIHDGRYRVGDRIPSQADLEDRFQVSRPTIQRALGVLRDDGYIDNQRGRPSEVLPWQEGAGVSKTQFQEPEITPLSLKTHIATAFDEPHVTIDAYSLTTETLGRALVAPLLRVQNRELNPESVTLRLLLPSLDARLAIPRLVDDPDDERPMRRLRQLVRAHALALRSSFVGLTEFRPDIQASIEMRAVPITPVHKLYLINGHTALSGHYQVVKRQVEFGKSGKGAIYDVLGINAMLFAYRGDPAEPESRDSQFVADSQSWFDSLWSTIAEPLSLFE
ncbi:transcriptional regulator, GntR family [Actinacidiphila alni]|uniref:Transcriptional regulator, GntR family n=1 Tax=Actinacidiphila alni TaxID=380248 RepID=A0A1I2KRC6_9ACTN|nr:winged helix-turn-helix domain-containing protein [Actinacidiphila alni]SFF69063.1 transcriptional regulator, GntR family [Actinacidiphila alni]